MWLIIMVKCEIIVISGCLLLGSGKQSLARLAAFITGLEPFQITIRKGYGIADLKADLAALYIKAGVKNIGCMFLMTDAQVCTLSGCNV